MFDAIAAINDTPVFIWIVLAIVAGIGVLYENHIDEERRALRGEWRLI